MVEIGRMMTSDSLPLYVQCCTPSCGQRLNFELPLPCALSDIDPSSGRIKKIIEAAGWKLALTGQYSCDVCGHVRRESDLITMGQDLVTVSLDPSGDSIKIQIMGQYDACYQSAELSRDDVTWLLAALECRGFVMERRAQPTCATCNAAPVAP
jgi:hypothetical protein